MAFTRNFLKSTGLTDEQISAVMEEHVSVVDALKSDRDNFKAQAEKAADLQRQLDELANGEDFKKKFEDEHRAFEDFKKQTASEAEAEKIRAAFRELLAEEKIGGSKERIKGIIRATDFSGMKLGKDGRLENEGEIRQAINRDWGEFKTTISEKGADVEKPPQTGKPVKSREEILAIKDTTERQKAIAENLQVFGKG